MKKSELVQLIKEVVNEDSKRNVKESVLKNVISAQGEFKKLINVLQTELDKVN